MGELFTICLLVPYFCFTSKLYFLGGKAFHNFVTSQLNFTWNRLEEKLQQKATHYINDMRARQKKKNINHHTLSNHHIQRPLEWVLAAALYAVHTVVLSLAIGAV